MSIEREFKADVAETFELPELDGVAGLRAVDRGVRHLEATYWDTDDLHLLRSGHGLRYRTTDGSDGLWTLKSGSQQQGGAMVRDELEVSGPPNRVPPDVADRLRGEVDLSAIHPVAWLRTARHVVELSDGGTPWAEVADDTVLVLRGEEEVHRFRELEVELHGAEHGSGKAQNEDDRVDRVLARLREVGAGAPTASSKYVRALLALGYQVGGLRDA
jgi:inorganic triphosphatase YgiF